MGKKSAPIRRPKNWEKLRGGKSGIDPEAIKAEVSTLWRESDNGKAFAAALESRGYILCKGDRRDFCLIDPAGHEHSLARRIEGAKAAEIRERLSGIDREGLPSVAEGREGLRREPETQKERIAEMQYEHFIAPVHEAMRETGETPLYGMEPTWWERAAGVVGRMAEKTVEVAGRAWGAARRLWQDLLSGRDDVERSRDDDGMDR